MEILGKLFGSQAKVKLMRLFLLNKNKAFKNKDIAKRSRITPETLRRELRLLAAVDLIRKKAGDWQFNPAFKHTRQLENLLVSSEALKTDAITENFKNIGRVKLLLVAGIFIKDKDSRVDLLIVGDGLRRGRIEEGVRKLEAEIGRELVYALFDTKEFLYRFNMYDKLVRDILDFPHTVLLQTKELSHALIPKGVIA